MSAAPVIIAEGGVNHNGDEGLAMALVDVAADAGADWIKFQTFNAAELVTGTAPRAAYQKTGGADGGQLEMLVRLELSHDAHRRLAAHCAKRNIGFLSTPFDLGSLRFLVDGLGLDTLKLGSGDLTNAPLLLAIARSGRRLFLSTGMSNLATIEAALSILAFGYLGGREIPSREAFRRAFAATEARPVLAEKVTLLHCVSAYPAPVGDINLHAMGLLAGTFGLPAGYSDHTEGTAVAVAAAALGARVIEKHLTTDRTLPGPDHAASLEPAAFAALVRDCRAAARALGTAAKQVMACEADVRQVARKSLVARTAIKAGTPFSTENLTTKRPAGGIDALDYFDWIGRSARRDYEPDEMIDG